MTLGTQLFVTRNGPPRRGEYPSSRVDNKPFRALWTSTFLPDGPFASAWIEMTGLPYASPVGNVPAPAYLLRPSKRAAVREIGSAGDWSALLERYSVERGGLLAAIDWERVSDDYDAVHMKGAGVRATHTLKEDSSNGWDVESTAWFRWAFSGVESYDGPLVRTDQAAPRRE